MRDLKKITVGNLFSCAIMADDSVKCGGSPGHVSGFGLIPSVINEFQGAKDISTGGASVCAVMGDDTVKCAGFNSFGMFDMGNSNNLNLPTTISNWGLAKKVSLGGNSLCVIGMDNLVRCAGYTPFGTLGNSEAADSFYMTEIPVLSFY